MDIDIVKGGRNRPFREKLIELIQSAVGGCANYWAMVIADYRISSGVTIQRWIPVTERLPEEMDWVLCACKDGEVRILAYDFIMDDWDIHGRPNSCYGKAFVTHWMPLPTPPKGE